MSLTNPKGIFKPHSVCFYDLDDGKPIAIFKVIKSAGLDLKGEYDDLMGGSSLVPWDSEIKSLSSAVKMVLGEYIPGACAKFIGGNLTENVAEASGGTHGFANVKGTSIKDNTNGIVSISVDPSYVANLKEGKYLIVAADSTGATTDEIDIYAFTDLDFSRGDDVAYLDDTGKIIESLQVTNDLAVDELGIILNTTSGTIQFTPGDSAEFYVRKPNSSSFVLDFGQSGFEFEGMGCIIFGQKMSNGSIWHLELYNVKGAGMPINFGESWSELSIDLKALMDTTRDKAGTLRRTIAV